MSRRSSLCLGAGTNSCATTAWSNQVTYGYEPLDGQLSALTHTLKTTTLSFGYARNPAYQIQMLTASDPFYLPTPTTVVTTSYAPNNLNEYATVASNAYTSDANGNLLTWTPPGSTTVQTDTYDSENRLTSAVVPGATTDSFDYDALGRRVSKTYNGVETYYLHDADEEIAEYSGSLSSSGTLLRRYVTGPAVDDRIVHIESGSTAPPLSAHTYYHVNHQGSVIAMTDYAGNVSGGAAAGQQLAYDEYGNLSSASNSTGEQFRFTGRRYDAETGLYYYRARYYSPQLGRFLQVDPVGYKDDIDLYTYVGNDPLDKTDPTGKQLVEGAAAVGCAAQPEICAFVAAVVVLGGGAVVENAAQNSSHQDDSGQKQDSNSNSGDGGNGNKNGPGKDPAPPATGNKPESKTPEGAGRSGAFRQAKEDNDIPRSQQPDKTSGNTDRSGRDTPGRQYHFTRPDGSKTTIRDDAGGHQYPDNPSQDRGPHFNDENGNHYDYPPTQ